MELKKLSDSERKALRKILSFAFETEKADAVFKKLCVESISERIEFIKKEFGISVFCSSSAEGATQEEIEYADYIAVLATLADLNCRR